MTLRPTLRTLLFIGHDDDAIFATHRYVSLTHLSVWHSTLIYIYPYYADPLSLSVSACLSLSTSIFIYLFLSIYIILSSLSSLCYAMLLVGKPSPRCVLNYPWAVQWKGPMTVYFGHDTARGMQVHKSAIGIDTGRHYVNHHTSCSLS